MDNRYNPFFITKIFNEFFILVMVPSKIFRIFLIKLKISIVLSYQIRLKR